MAQWPIAIITLIIIVWLCVSGCAMMPETYRSQAIRQADGPPPGYVAPQQYWVREKIILR